MAKYYSGISEGETLDSMVANGSTYGISPSKTIDCSSVIADTSIEVSTDSTKIFEVASNGLVKGTLHTLITIEFGKGEYNAVGNGGAVNASHQSHIHI